MADFCPIQSAEGRMTRPYLLRAHFAVPSLPQNMTSLKRLLKGSSADDLPGRPPPYSSRELRTTSRDRRDLLFPHISS